jgi:hypothetical protein
MVFPHPIMVSRRCEQRIVSCARLVLLEALMAGVIGRPTSPDVGLANTAAMGGNHHFWGLRRGLCKIRLSVTIGRRALRRRFWSGAAHF